MAAIKRNKPKTFSYKKCEFQQSSNGQLQQSLTGALDAHVAAASRFHLISPQDESYRFINHRLVHKGALCGDFCSYTRGNNQPFLHIDNTAPSLEINQLAPPGQKTEYVEGILFFAIRNNAAVIVQSNTLKIPQFESYLNWFIRDHAKLCDEQELIGLIDPIPSSIRAKKVRTVKSIRLEKPLKLKVQQQQRGESVSVRPSNELLSALKPFFPSAHSLFRGLQIAEWVDPESIRAKLELKWRPRIEDEDVPVLDEIARALPESELEDYLITLQDGTKLKRQDLKKSKAFSIPHVGVMPAQDVLYDRMVEWLDSASNE